MIDEIKEKLKFKPINKLEPKCALVFYDSEDCGDYVEKWEIHKNKIIQKKPAYIEELKMLNKYAGGQQDFEFDERLSSFLTIDTTKKEFSFITKEKEIELMFNKTIYKLKLPNILWIVKGKDVKVFCYKSTLKKDTILYKLPTPNVYNDGKICWGNVKYEINSLSDVLMLERLFFESNFNEDLSIANFNVKPEKFYKMNYREQRKNLVKTNLKVKNVINTKIWNM